jgi:hypothetical protein
MQCKDYLLYTLIIQYPNRLMTEDFGNPKQLFVLNAVTFLMRLVLMFLGPRWLNELDSWIT